MVAIALQRVRAADLVELTKPRIVLMVMITAGAGFWMAGPEPGQVMTLFHLLLGTALVAGGASALNQIVERDADALMRRTSIRPMPQGRLDVPTASAFAWTIGLGGIVYLATLVNLLTGALAAATLGSYVLLYTPLKRRTSLATLVGGVPGALPIVGGWAAASGRLTPETAVLFWILFLWQLPHFLALGWLYRDEYSRAGFRMLSADDPDGRITFLNASVYAAALVPVSLVPTILGLAGGAYFLAALVLSGGFLAFALVTFREATRARARRLFLMSLAYLPLLLVAMAVNRIS